MNKNRVTGKSNLDWEVLIEQFRHWSIGNLGHEPTGVDSIKAFISFVENRHSLLGFPRVKIYQEKLEDKT